MVNGEGRLDRGRSANRPRLSAASSVASTSAGIAREPNAPGNEFADRDLVGGVEHGRRRAAGGQRLPRQAPAPGSAPDPAPRRSACQSWRDRAAPPRCRSAPARPGNARSECACRASRAGRPPSRREIRPAHAPPTAGAPARRSRPACSANRWCASISSRPLFISVAESMVTFGPIDQLGCRSACSGVAARDRSAVQVRNGPPEAVRMMRRTSSRRPAVSAWNMALCSLSTGSTVGAGSGRAPHEQAAGAHQTFLVGERDGGAALDRGQGRLQPGRAG